MDFLRPENVFIEFRLWRNQINRAEATHIFGLKSGADSGANVVQIIALSSVWRGKLFGESSRARGWKGCVTHVI